MNMVIVLMIAGAYFIFMSGWYYAKKYNKDVD